MCYHDISLKPSVLYSLSLHLGVSCSISLKQVVFSSISPEPNVVGSVILESGMFTYYVSSTECVGS